MTFLVLAAVVACAGAEPASAGKRVALVIGNSNYQHTSPLQNPKNDAQDIAQLLSSLDFEVVRGLDLTKSEMEKTIRHFATMLVGAEVGLFFYAGHGLQVDGTNYLVPVDAKADTTAALDFEMLQLKLIQRTMERETKTNVIMLDACRDNPLSRNLARALGTRSNQIDKGLAQEEAGVGTLISYATQPGNVALDGSGRNSPYTAALKKHLTAKGEDLTSILINVRNEVMKETEMRQIPWDQHALTAKLYLNGPAEAPATAVATTTPRPAASPPLSEAAQTWMIIKDSTSIGVLRAFAERFRGGVFADMAEARIAELKEQRVAARSPAPEKLTRKPEPKAKPKLALPDGKYSSSVGAIRFECDAAGQCIGRYQGSGDGLPAKIVGKVNNDGVFNGTWVEASSNTRCATARHGSYYWGEVRFAFSANRGSWEGKWSYCDGALGGRWNGSR